MKNKQTILIVDDTQVYLDIVTDLLQDQYQIITELDGNKTLDIVKNKNPDLILLDILMPQISGFEVCTQLKNDAQTKNIPIIFLTALNENEDELKGLKLGAVDYITKPIQLPILLARIQTHLQLRSMQIELEYQAKTDYLTGCYNRRYFFTEAKKEINRHKRYQHTLSILMIDVDYFKAINDTYGHDKGDQQLQALATQIKAMLREHDLFARFGGEEFVILLPETKKEQAIVVAEKARKRLSKMAGDSKIKMTVSIGVASHTNPDETLEAILKRADEALYQAKNSGRNQVIATD